MALSEEQFGEWKNHPLTLEVMAALRKKRQDLMELIASGRFTHERADTTAIDTAAAIGECQCLKSILEMSHDDYLSELEQNDGPIESKRPSAPRQSSAD